MYIYTLYAYMYIYIICIYIYILYCTFIPDRNNCNDQAIIIIRETGMGDQLRTPLKLFEHHSTMVSRGLRKTPNKTLITSRAISLSDNLYIFFLSGL